MEIPNFKDIKPEVKLSKAAKFLYYLGGAIVGFCLFLIVGGQVNRHEADMTLVIIGAGLGITFVGFAYLVLSEILVVLRRIDNKLNNIPSQVGEWSKPEKLLADKVPARDESATEK